MLLEISIIVTLKLGRREAPWLSGFSDSGEVQKVAVKHEFEAGKDKAMKGEGRALQFISCAQDAVGL